MLLLEVSHRNKRESGESKCKLESNIPTVRRTAKLADWASEPNLGHSKHGTHDTEGKSYDGSDPNGKLVFVHIDSRIISSKTALEEEMFGKRDTLIDSEPVSDQQHEIFKNRLEVSVSRDGDGAVNNGPDEGPHEARYALRDTGEELEGERDGIDVWAVVGDDRESENDKAELTEPAKRRNDDSCEETSNSRGVIAVYVQVVTVVGGYGSSHGCTEHLSEKEREYQTSECPAENGLAGAVDWLVNSVVGGI